MGMRLTTRLQVVAILSSMITLGTLGATASIAGAAEFHTHDVGGALAQPQPTVVIAPITGIFSPNPTDSGSFTTGPGVLAQDFPVLNFNPPAGTVPCTNGKDVTILTR